jgi:hypothetical protein
LQPPRKSKGFAVLSHSLSAPHCDVLLCPQIGHKFFEIDATEKETLMKLTKSTTSDKRIAESKERVLDWLQAEEI